MEAGTKKNSTKLVVPKKKPLIKQMQKNWQLYLLIILPLVYLIIFKYVPMVGVQIAFKKYMPLKGMFGSPWVGFAHFQRFFKSHIFWNLMKNTLGISFYNLIIGFPFPIILALSLNYTANKSVKKSAQMITYAPYFISTVVMVGMILQMLSMRGVVNNILSVLGLETVNFMGDESRFWSIYVWTNVWKNMGYGSIIYLAALAGIDPQLHEAATVDGATKLQGIWHIDIPGIMPTAVIMLILSVGRIMSLGFEKILLMQNSLNLGASEVIQTYVYKIGIAGGSGNFSYPSAIGLFQSVINLILLISVNKIAKKVSETSLW
jgi:ABC-type polysaccharide transport system permease subunit